MGQGHSPGWARVLALPRGIRTREAEYGLELLACWDGAQFVWSQLGQRL